MSLSTIKIAKYLFSLLCFLLAYYYFILGTTEMSNYTSNQAIIIDSTQKDEIGIEKNNQIEEIKKDNERTEKESLSKNYNEDFDKKLNKNFVEDFDTNFTKYLEKKETSISEFDEKIIEIIVKKGETFSSILSKQNIKKINKQNIINETQKELDLKKLNIGQKIIFFYNVISENETILKKISIPISYREEIIIDSNNGKILAKKINLPIFAEKKAFNVKIKKSIFQDGSKKGLPNSILIDLIRLYSFDVDFQRDIRVNDEFIVLYEVYYNEQKREVAYGDILYSNLKLQKKDIEYYIFETSAGLDYFNKEGKNAKKAIMKTPIDGARLSSGFGMRKHPILGYNVKHKGVDFAAPTGTPVYAAGNGTIEYKGSNGAYGRYIRIRHNSNYKTAYAHLSGYKKGIGKGTRVMQGDIIGYVGSSGRSTGPHLHYEVIFNGDKINPMKMKLPSGKSLKGSDLENFKLKSAEIDNLLLENLMN